MKTQELFKQKCERRKTQEKCTFPISCCVIEFLFFFSLCLSLSPFSSFLEMKSSVLVVALLLMALMGVCKGESSSGGGLSTASIVIIVVAATIMVILLVTICVMFYFVFMRKRGAANKAAHDNPIFEETDEEMKNPTFA